MRVLIIGYGSMGKRRIRLLQKLVKDTEICCVDSNPQRQEDIRQAGLTCYADLGQALQDPFDFAFVCTSPGHHADIILALVRHGIHVFTELNLIDDGYDEIQKAAKDSGSVVFMSSTMLYNKQIEKIDQLVRQTKGPLTYIYHIGQYLPDWHPWESYKDFFIGKKETNGVREIYAIQLPWIIHTFGKIKSLSANKQRCTGLDIDFSDSILASFTHENGNIGVFAADTVSRKAVTSLEVIGENLHLFWNGHNDDLRIYDYEEARMVNLEVYDHVEHEEGYADNINENQYADEIQDFLNTVYQHTVPRYSLEEDKYTLSIINQIEGV